MMAETRFEGFGGLSLAAETFGVAGDPAVLFLHGAAQSRAMWRSAAEALASAGRHVIAFDLRGHGESEWARDGRYDLDAYAGDIRAILARMSSRPAIVGASLGGLAALAALEVGGDQQASALILVDAIGRMHGPGAKRFHSLFDMHAQGFATIADALTAAVELAPRREQALTEEALREHLVEREDGRFYWRWDPQAVRGMDVAALEERLNGAAKQIGIPVLLLRGERSEIVSREGTEEFAALLRDCEQVEIPGASHLSPGDQADLFNAAIVDFLERRVPREPIAYRAGSDPRTLRDALGCFATGVTIVTSLDPEGKPIGLTANSFTSVSLDPPLILFCLAKSSGSLPALTASSHFAINVLHMGQQLSSNRFAKRDEERFSAVEWETWQSGVPILSGSLASFECERHELVDAGDHLVFIGRVIMAKFEPRRDPLLYFRGKYRRLHFA
jgi:flavin reductase (DIM6/NTAB) family NADH-FMN oxidoreductase RutF/pimeloyl-ACP methyl ester carboxylesterase